MINQIFCAFVGLCSGLAVSAGIFAFIVSLGIVERMAAFTHTAAKIRLYENMIFLGAVFGNILSIYKVNLRISTIGSAIFGLLCGVFTGLIAIALVEILQAIPIMMRRVKIHTGLGFVILFLALGKLCGSLLQFSKFQ